MEIEELKAALRENQQKGFDDAFVSYCAREFSSHSYPQENLAPARAHAIYLRLAIDAVLGDMEFPASDNLEANRIEKVFLEVVRKSKEAVLETGRPFCEVFIELWCRNWAEA